MKRLFAALTILALCPLSAWAFYKAPTSPTACAPGYFATVFMIVNHTGESVPITCSITMQNTPDGSDGAKTVPCYTTGTSGNVITKLSSSPAKQYIFTCAKYENSAYDAKTVNFISKVYFNPVHGTQCSASMNVPAEYTETASVNLSTITGQPFGKDPINPALSRPSLYSSCSNSDPSSGHPYCDTTHSHSYIWWWCSQKWNCTLTHGILTIGGSNRDSQPTPVGSCGDTGLAQVDEQLDDDGTAGAAAPQSTFLFGKMVNEGDVDYPPAVDTQFVSIGLFCVNTSTAGGKNTPCPKIVKAIPNNTPGT